MTIGSNNMVIPGRRNVLIVDDEPSITSVLDLLLKGEGFATETAASGDEAIVKLMGQEFEIILTDLNMPGLNGIDVLRRALAEYPDTGVIMITAVADSSVAVDAMKLGAFDYILKPFNLEDVLVRVEKAREKRFLIMQVKNHQKDVETRLADRERELRAMTINLVQSMIKDEAREAPEKSKGGKRGPDLKALGMKLTRRINESW